MSVLLIDRAVRFASRVALADDDGEHRYDALASAANARAEALRRLRTDLDRERVAYLIAPGFDHVATQWAVWRAGAIAVPLPPSHPAPELARVIADARPALLIAQGGLVQRAREAAATAAALCEAGGAESADSGPVPVLDSSRLDAPVADATATTAGVDGGEPSTRDPSADASSAPDARPSAGVVVPLTDPSSPALMVYTSGTTGHPKGVVTTHGNLEAQITTLVEAWEWTREDRILHVLPLHHIHGIVNAMCCALWAGARCDFGAPDATEIWERFAAGGITLFMAVPTIYRRLIEAWQAADDGTRRRWTEGARHLRLTVSGSAALPAETFGRWEAITGHRLLERYGMTEIGMALGNPLHGERRPGTVGLPLPGVEARIVEDGGGLASEGEQGEIQVRGAQVFREYWQRPDDTRAAFTEGGWFRSGDEGMVEDGYWRILGRRSVDIIKTGGYKVSALEIEAALRLHPQVVDAAVVGVPDEEWGERVCAAVVMAAGVEPDPQALRTWCKQRLAAYKVPKQFARVVRMPRNTMGKVTKPELHPLFFEPASRNGSPRR